MSNEQTIAEGAGAAATAAKYLSAPAAVGILAAVVGQNSTLLRLLNGGNYAAAADQFPVWNKGGGGVLPGLVKRRAMERALFLTQEPA